MKKALIVAVLFGIGFSSCKKENEVKPSVKSEKSVMVGEKKDMGGWD
ncbi:hypothetical protein [Pararcticibacter amylolyticus]|nr:hypothetical protein [Pararcticibacter amylolyticus]